MSIIKDAEFVKRIKTIRKKMEDQSIDFMIIYSDIWRTKNVAYFTDYRSGAGGIGQAWNVLLLPVDGELVLFTGFEMVGDALLQGRNLKQVFSSVIFESEFKKYCDINKPKKVGIIGYDIICRKVYSIVNEALHGAEIIDCDELHAREIWVKTEDEIKAIKKATKINDKALTAVIDAIKEGVSENELSAIGASVITGHGADLAFFPTVGTGTNSALAMKRPTDRKVKSGDVILLDFGAVYEGYASDTARTIGYQLTDSNLRNMIDAALEAREAALALVKPGVVVNEIEKAVRNAIIKKGFGDYILHNCSHGLGIDSSEEDFPMSLTSALIIEKGMVFTIEPGIYIPNVAGCRIEEVVHVTQNGCEVFSELRPDYFIQ